MVILAVLLAFLLFPTTVAAQVIVNEIYPNPETVEQEWVELWNGGSSEISLSGWELWDQQSSPSLLHQFNNTIAADEFFVITLQSVLNNSGDSVILKDSNGVEIDRLDYSSSTKGKSWSRNPDNLGEVVLTAPTQGTTNSIPTPSPTPVINNSPPPALSEVMACPDSGNEWIELFNPHHQTVNLAGFALHDNKSQVALLENETLGSQK